MVFSAGFVIRTALAAVVLVAAMPAAQEAAPGPANVTVISTPATDVSNEFYTGNREPLLPSRFIKLPVGSIQPKGWLRGQLELQASGFIGHLMEISKWCRREGNAWTHARGEGEFGWEEVPYWLKGFLDLGYILDDQRIIGQANQWTDAVLASQRPNGYFGGAGNLKGTSYRSLVLDSEEAPDLWPNMVMLYPLRSLYEATGDKRVLEFMTRYFRWQSTIPLDKMLPMTWAKWRAGDNLDSIHWLYNRTGEKWLLDLARVNHERTADWTAGIPTWHVVNIAQCFREPAQYYQQAHDIRYYHATERNYDLVREIYGQVPGGLYAGDENARPGFTGPRQGTETCAMVEMLYSHEMLLAISGDPKWADRAEDIAFNTFPTSMSPDLKGLHYVSAPNMVQLTKSPKSPMIQNGGDMLSYSPHRYRCCQHNVSWGWPYYAEHLWMATPDNGLSPVLYAASEVKAKVGDGTEVTIAETTEYPFDEAVQFAISAPKPVRFPLTLRIPAWCDAPQISVNGQSLSVPQPARNWVRVERTWKDGDKLRLELPMKISTTVWKKNRNTVSVHRGPISYSLKIGERWERSGGTDKWPEQEVYPTTPWNYGLVLDSGNPATSFEVVKKDGPLARQPFTVDDAPIMLRAKGKRIPEWGLEPNGFIEEVQPGPVRTGEPAEDITLIPMGCARLRISSFPRVGTGSDARQWKDTIPIALASYSTHADPPSALNDDIVPATSADSTVPRFSWTPYKGTVGYWPEVHTTGTWVLELPRSKEWVEYRFSRPRRFSSVEVYWVDDRKTRGRVRAPSSWRVVYRDGEQWKPVENAAAYGTEVDTFNRVEFQPVETTVLRIEADLRPQFSAGIFEWRVSEE